MLFRPIFANRYPHYLCFEWKAIIINIFFKSIAINDLYVSEVGVEYGLKWFSCFYFVYTCGNEKYFRSQFPLISDWPLSFLRRNNYKLNPNPNLYICRGRKYFAGDRNFYKLTLLFFSHAFITAYALYCTRVLTWACFN